MARSGGGHNRCRQHCHGVAAQDLRDDAEWVRRHSLPWAMRRVRGTSSGDGLVAKQPEPRSVVAAQI